MVLAERRVINFPSDYSGEQVKLPKVLLNGNNICMVRLRLELCWKLTM